MKIYCDGSANPNPGPGGFGVIALDKSENLVYHIYRESSENTTNNREELKAILYCLEHFGVITEDEFDLPIVYSDSAYAINTYTDWMFSWARNDWRKSDGQKAENLDLIQKYYDLYNEGYRISLVKVRGHSNNKWNEFADALAGNRVPLYKLNKQKWSSILNE
mgnify:CR=1 FL=1